MSRTAMTPSGSPSSCPDLDFSDCLPTPLSPSPRQRRPRGAPWASKRPRPFVDRPNAYEQEQDAGLCTRSLEQQQNECITTHLQHSPLKRRASHQICNPERQEIQPLHSTYSDDLLHLLFPEVCRLQNDNDKRSTQSSKTKQSFIAQAYRHSSNTRNDDNQFEEVRCTQTYETSRPSETPGRLHPHHDTSNEQNTEISRPTTRSIYKTNPTYSSKKKNKSVLRSAAIKQFEDITGVTTSSRIEAAATRQSALESESEEEARSREHRGSSPSQERIQTSSNALTLSNNSTYHEYNVNRISSRHIYNAVNLDTVTPQDQHDEMCKTVKSRPHVTQTRSSSRLARKRREHQSSDKLLGAPSYERPQSACLERNLLTRSAPASSSPYQTEHQDGCLTDHQGPIDVAAKHEKYEQYVYEQLLVYPPQHCKDDDLRPGYKPLEMGYLIPPPSGRLHDDHFDQESQDYQNIRELRLMILGRISQTEFKILQDKAAKARLGKPRVPRRKKGKEDDAQLYESEDDTSKSGRKKPLSHLNLNTLVNKQTLLALEAAIGEGGKENHVNSKSKHDKTQVLRKGKGNIKKAQLAPGHLPLQLMYSHAKAGMRNVTRARGHEEDRQNRHIHEDEEQIRGRPILAAHAHTSEKITIQEAVQDTSSRAEVSVVAAETPAHIHQTSSPKSQRSIFQPHSGNHPPTLCAPAPMTRPIEGNLSSRSPEQKDLDLCDILMPMSTQTRRPNSVRPFTLRTTNTTSHAYESIQDRFVVEDESFSGLPSALWYDENEEFESPDKSSSEVYPSYLQVNSSNEATFNTPAGRAILAPSSSCISNYLQQTPLAASKGSVTPEDQYCQRGSPTRSLLAANDKSQALATASSVPAQSTCLSNWDDAYEEYPSPSYQSVSFTKFDYDGATPSPEEAYSSGILIRDHLPSSALNVPRDNIPAEHQPCYTPISDYWHECTEPVQTVPSDIERQCHVYPEEYYQHDYIAFPLQDIPSPQPAPATPEDEFNGVEMSLQTKLGAYGRRIVELEAPYTKLRERPVKRKIPKDTTPPENQQVQILGMHTVTNNQ